MPSPSERSVELTGARSCTARHGGGPPLVLLHGGPGLWDSFDELAALVEDIAEVHRYDQRGCGRSSGPPPYTVAAFLADLDALRRHWGHDRWIVAGHSAGAWLALAYAVEHPDRVQALICLDGGGDIDEWSRAHFREVSRANRERRSTAADRERHAALSSLLRESPEAWTSELDREYAVLSWQTDFADATRGPALARALLRPYPPNFAVNAAIIEDWQRVIAGGAFAARLARLDLPTLVVHGANDPRPQVLAERLAGMLKDGCLVVIPSAGHWPWLENPEPAREALRGFLMDLPPSPP